MHGGTAHLSDIPLAQISVEQLGPPVGAQILVVCVKPSCRSWQGRIGQSRQKVI